MERLFGNLKNKGTPCTLTEVYDVNNPIIGGKVLEIRPLVPKGGFQSLDTLVIILKEAYATDENSRSRFKAVFMGRAAKLLNNVNLVKDDCLAFCGVVLTKDSALKRPYTHSQQVTIGVWPGINTIDNCYYRRRGMEHWSRLVALSHVGNCSHESSTSNERTEQNSSNVIDENDNNGGSRNDTEAVNPIVNNLYRYVKLSEVQVNAKCNVYAIVRKIVKIPTFSQINGQYHHMISVIDETLHETKANGFLVHIFSKTIDDFPRIKMYDIIRFHRLRIEQHDDRIDGKVSKGQDLLVFDKDNTKITYKTSKTCTLTEADRERAEELKRWMYKNIPDAWASENIPDAWMFENVPDAWTSENVPEPRPFTSLNELQLKQQTINLRGEISDIKIGDQNYFALRIRDGTKCTVPSFNVDSWQNVLKKSKCFHSESGEIDIIVVEPAQNFKILKIGERIELYDVKVIVLPEYTKTTASNFIKFYMKGKVENLKEIMSHKRTHSKTDDTSTKNVQSEQKARKRKLFHPDVSNFDFENDDTDVDVTNNPNTRNEEMVHSSELKAPPRVENSSNNESSTSNERTERGNDSDSNNRNDGNLAPIRNDNLVHENDVEITTNTDLSKTDDEVIIEETNNCNNHLVNEGGVEIDNIDNSRNVPNNEDAPAAESPNGLLIHEEGNNKSTTVNNADLIANNFERTCVDCFDNCSCSESSIQCGEFYTKWPKNPASWESFKIRVILLSTTPAIDETSCDDDVMLLLHYYCEPCEIFHPKDRIKWDDIDEEDPKPQCPECGAGDLPPLFKLEMFVQDRYFGAETVVILGKFADDFFGCSPSDFMIIKECRIKIKNMIVNYLAKSWKKKVPLVLQVIPQESPRKYHVTGISSS